MSIQASSRVEIEQRDQMPLPAIQRDLEIVKAAYKRLSTYLTWKHWNAFIGNYLIQPLYTLMPCLANKIANLARGFLLYPSVPIELQKEEERFAKLQDEKIKKYFTVEYRSDVVDGVAVDYKVLELKQDSPQESSLLDCNIMIIPGNVSNIRIGQEAIPFAWAIKKLQKEKRSLPKVRIIVVSPHDIKNVEGNSLQPSFKEAAFIFKSRFLKFKKEYGKMNIVAISLGCELLKALLDVSSPTEIEEYITSLFFHVAPTSLKEVSRLYWGGRAIIWEALQNVGGYINPSLKTLCKKTEELIKNRDLFIGVFGLYGESDYYFPEKISLCNSRQVKELQKQKLLGIAIPFKISRANYHIRSHHGLPMNHFTLNEAINPKTGDFIIDGQESDAKTADIKKFLVGNLPTSIVENILTRMQTQLPLNCNSDNELTA